MKKLDAVLDNKHLIGIAGHVRPDGDCVGSTLAVYNYIRTYYPDVDVRLYLEPIPNIFKFLRYSEIPEDLEMQQNILKVQNTRIVWIIMSAIRRLQRKITFFRKQVLPVNLYMS